jgi:hypothetical protein
MRTTAFDKFAGLCAILAGIVMFVYALAFVVIANRAPSFGSQLSSLCLLLNGLLITVPLTALYNRLRDVDESFALWAFILGLVGAFGAAIHGGYDLANAINPPAAQPPELATALAALPNQVDPRGLLTFGVSAIAIFVFARLMASDDRFPNSFRYMGFLLALLLGWLYAGRLLILDPTNLLLLVPILLTGFVINPAWYLWLGFILRREMRVSSHQERVTHFGMSTEH